MNIRDHAESLLQTIANDLPEGLLTEGALKFDDNDECLFTLNHRIPLMIYLEEGSRSLILNAPIGLLPTGPAREAMMLEMLHANYCWNMTEGGTLGVDRTTGLICISYLVALPLEDPTQMPAIINKLAGVAQHWQHSLQERCEDDAAEADPSPTYSGMIRA